MIQLIYKNKIYASEQIHISEKRDAYLDKSILSIIKNNNSNIKRIIADCVLFNNSFSFRIELLKEPIVIDIDCSNIDMENIFAIKNSFDLIQEQFEKKMLSAFSFEYLFLSTPNSDEYEIYDNTNKEVLTKEQAEAIYRNNAREYRKIITYNSLLASTIGIKIGE